MQPHIFIGTPTYGGMVYGDYTSSLVSMLHDLTKHGITFTYYPPAEGTLIDVQRDKIAKEFLASEATHLLFIDSDIRFEPALARKLLSTGMDFIGAVYTKRGIDGERLRTLCKQGVDYDAALILSHDFSCRNIIGEGGDLYETDGVGMGFTLIARSVFEHIKQSGQTEEYTGHSNTGPLTGYFSPTNDNGKRLQEDFSFCARHRKAGGKIWGYASGKIGHIGKMTFGVSLASYIEAKKKLSGVGNNRLTSLQGGRK